MMTKHRPPRPARPAATRAATSTAKLPTVAIGKHDLSFEAHSIQDLDALADAELLRDVRGEGGETRQRNELSVGSRVAIGGAAGEARLQRKDWG